MLINPDPITARDLLLQYAAPVNAEQLPLSLCAGRILAEDLTAAENIPPFDRSPYDGYAFRAEDTAFASEETPVTLTVLEEIPAGSVPTKTVVSGTAAKVLTGSPIPPGADAVIKYEDTVFTQETVCLFSPVRSGSNIVRTGEDVQKGAVLARCGTVIDPGLAGTLASQGKARPPVYRKPRVAILSTGSELVEADEPLPPGKIRNSNRYMLEAALRNAGCEPVCFGIAVDTVAAIANALEQCFARCDAAVITGGVSAGDYDVTPDAMEQIGAQLLFRGAAIKPGMACAYGIRSGKLICGLSGNPASSLINFYAIALPALRRLAGCRDPLPEEITVTLNRDFHKSSPTTRYLRGQLCLKNGTVSMDFSKEQGNVVLSSSIGCNVLAVIPAGSGPVAAGTKLKGYLL
ncbi:MAG: molybdopterin molybdotransferase MoeA [Firmicutes bacterium]|nr:molybdopterin molybdotransferase MoeA [Bacillota bacterium]